MRTFIHPWSAQNAVGSKKQKNHLSPMFNLHLVLNCVCYAHDIFHSNSVRYGEFHSMLLPFIVRCELKEGETRRIFSRFNKKKTLILTYTSCTYTHASNLNNKTKFIHILILQLKWLCTFALVLVRVCSALYEIPLIFVKFLFCYGNVLWFFFLTHNPMLDTAVCKDSIRYCFFLLLFLFLVA